MTVSDGVLAIEEAMQTILDTILDTHTRELTAAWASAWSSIRDDLEVALIELADAGDTSGTAILRSRRIQAGLVAAGEALDILAEQSGGVITDDVARVLGLGVDGELAMIGEQLPEGRQFSRPDPETTAAVLQRSTEQIMSVALPISAETAVAIRTELARGIIVGDNPREAARRMLVATEGRFTGGLTRALNISRTEMLDVLRSGQQAADLSNTDVLAEWMWSAHLDAKTCRSCIGKHGSRYPLDESGPHDHHSGRCARVPVTKTWAELGITGVEEPPDVTPDAGEWFDAQPEALQRQILTSRGYDAWRRGDYPIEQWSVQRSNDGWRDSHVPSRPPKEKR